MKSVKVNVRVWIAAPKPRAAKESYQNTALSYRDTSARRAHGLCLDFVYEKQFCKCNHQHCFYQP